jgi:hypothetical protein
MKRERIYFVQLRNELMKDEIKGLIQIQKVWRGYDVRAQGLRFVNWIFIRDVRNLAACIIQRHIRGMIAREAYLDYRSATAIQKAWRGHNGLDKFWNILGCAIQIQSIFRGWQCSTRYQKQREVVPTIQRAARCYMATEELERRKLIIGLVNEVNKKPQKEKQAQDWTAIVADGKRLDTAAGILQNSV